MNYYEEACYLSDGLGCIYLGDLYLNENSLDANLIEAKKYYDKACLLNESKGCYNYALLLGKEEKENSQKNKIRYLKKACKLGDKLSCFEIGPDF